MIYTFYKPGLWGYFKGKFLYRVNERYTKAIKILLSVVLGALILGGLYALFSSQIIPTLVQRIQEMFNYHG